MNNANWKERKVIVFQSDDWGLCSFCPDLEAFNALFANSNDKKIYENGRSTLESPNDMERLFQILLKYKGGDGKPVVFQPAYIMSNPDYDAIKSSGYKVYSDMVIPKVPSRWQRGDFIAKAKEGIEKKIWHPVFHGNTHFNSFKWMEFVKSGDKTTITAFNYQVSKNVYRPNDYEFDPELRTEQQELSISLGIKRFYDVFGYFPKSAIAPTYVWQNRTERIFSKYGIKIIQGKNHQVINRNFFTKIRGKLANITGKKAYDKPWQISMCDHNPRLDIYYLNRNVYFEPFGNKNAKHGAEKAFKDIVSAWERNEPAIVCTHRINYVYLDNNWVKESLNQLEILLAKIQNEHPEAIYMTDEELVSICEGESINEKEKDVGIHI